jgi:photosystem II stability/assembly factor-like uncharacterized protein
MFHVSTTLRRRLLVVAGLAAMAAPFAGDIAAQQAPPAPAPAAAILHQPTDPRLQGFRWRSIGPTGQGGRIDDIAADEKNPSTYYIGFAVSGLWKTENNGTTFENIFGEYNHSIGDIAIAPSNSNILYVGTGEPNNRQSSSFGDGMYKSTDAGKTWTHIGLRETQSIGRVVVHPRNPDIVWVAAVGHLFGPNDERGVFMTTDGGKTWSKTLYINQDTGATDLVIDPSNPNLLFAATYERRRTSWGFVGGGPGSALHQSVDGGKTWKKVTGGGLPRGTMGRIGLDFSRSNPNVIYAQIEVAPDKEPAAPASATPAAPADPAAGRAGGGGGGGRGGAAQAPDPTSSGVWRSADKGKTWTFQSNENQRPMYYSQIRVDPSNENYVFVGGVGPRKSLDGGKTWINLPNMGHVDNHAIWINPTNGRHVMYGNDGGLDVSYDQGETWDSVRLWAVGLPYHVSVDMRRPYNVCTGLQDNGSWCGPSGQRSGDIRMWNWMSVGGGDGFQTMVDPNDPNIFYTESQNGNITRYNLNDGTTANIRPRIGGAGRGGAGGPGGAGGSNVMNDLPADQVMQYNWNSPMRISPHNPSTILFGGRHFFVSRNRGDSWTMSPVMGKNIDISQRNILEQSYGLPACGRTPGVRCILSRHDGYVQNEYGTVVELEESPKVPGIYWVGTDDGNLQLSRDGGVSWVEVGKNIPGGTKEYHISGIEASKFDAATAYVALDGHRANDHAPYVFKTTDYGTTWTSIAGDLPRGNVNSIRQDPIAKNLLYAPTEYGFYISLNEGTNWMKFMPNIPNVRVDEVLVHPRENDLVLATHGYSIWIMDDITALQQLALAAPTAPTLYKPREAVQWKTDRRNQTEVPGSKYWAGDNMPRGTAISYFLPAAATDVLVTITNTATGTDVRTCTGTGNVGMNRFQWTLAGNAGPGGPGGRQGGGRQGGADPAAAAAPAAPAAPGPCAAPAGGGGRQGGGGGGFPGGGGGIGPGVYKVTLSVAGKEVGSQTFNVLEDIWLNQK